MAKGDYLSSNSWISYPFKQDQDIPEEIRRLFVDAVVSASKYDVCLTRLTYSIQRGTLRFNVDGKTYRMTVKPNTVYQVVRGFESSFVVDVSYLNTLDSFSFNGRAYFVSSCVDVDSGCIESVELFYGEDSPLNKTVKGDIVLEVGFNTEIEEGEDENTVVLSASPGSGLGVYPCSDDCEEDLDTDGHPLVTDNGNAVISGDGCYEVTARDDTIQIHGKCVACCQCQDFVDIVLELKKIAERLSGINTDITTKKTNFYFDFIDKFAIDYNSTAFDIQLDITPSQKIAAISLNGDPPTGFEDMESFRVTCMITNLCGFPCYFCTPDNWSYNECMYFYGGESVFHPMHVKPYGLDKMSPKQQLRFGIDAGVTGPGGILWTGFCVDTTVDIYAPKKDTLGYMTSSSCRGPVRRVKTSNGQIVNKYDYVDPRLPFYTDKQLKVEDVIEHLKELALRDLNSGKNPSYMISDAMGMTRALISNLPDAGVPGYLMPAGYTLTITNTYLVSVPEFVRNRGLKLFSHFYGSIYCPMLAYTCAYNTARPVRGDWEEVDDGYKVAWTWKETDLFRSIMKPGRIRHKICAWSAYSIDKGEHLLEDIF